MTVHSDCAHCGAICEPSFNTCSQECNLAYRKDGPKVEEEAPEGYFTLSDIGKKLGLSYSKLYFCVNKGRGRHVKPKGGKYSLEECAKLGLEPSTMPTGHTVIIGGQEVGGITASLKQAEPPLAYPEFQTPREGLQHERGRIEEQIREVNRALPKAIRERMLSAAKAAARDACLEAADEAKKAGDQWLRAQCLEDYLHIEEGLKMVFHGRGEV